MSPTAWPHIETWRTVVRCGLCGRLYRRLSRERVGAFGGEWSRDECPYCGTLNGGSKVIEYETFPMRPEDEGLAHGDAWAE